MTEPIGLAKIVWQDPHSTEVCEFILTEGATATIGRSSNNDIAIPEQHVSRQHAVVNYRDGVFMITDLGSSNGTFVNDQKIEEPFMLMAGDEIRLFVPKLSFMAMDDDSMDGLVKGDTSKVIVATSGTGQGCLIVTNGPQEGQTIPLLLDQVQIGRATTSASWEIMLQDPSVSRPHARLERHDDNWMLFDLGSANGTSVNNTPITEKGRLLQDGDTIALGGSILLFRSGWEAPQGNRATKLGR